MTDDLASRNGATGYRPTSTKSVPVTRLHGSDERVPRPGRPAGHVRSGRPYGVYRGPLGVHRDSDPGLDLATIGWIVVVAFILAILVVNWRAIWALFQQ